MKKFLLAVLLVCGMSGVSSAQGFVNYGYGPVYVPVVQVAAPVVVYKPVVVYQPVGVLLPVPVVQPFPAPVYYVPEIRRNCWNWFQPQPVRYYYYQ